jgi:hypothetical protein
MSRPTVLEHRTEIRALVQELTPVLFTDAEIDLNLSNALNVLSNFNPCLAKINLTGLSANQTSIDLSSGCPAGAVVEIIPAGGSPVTEFRTRGAELLLLAPLGATSADVVFRSRYQHDGVNVDWYPPHLHGALCMLATALLILGRAREVAETDFNKASALTTLATKLFDTALTMFGLPASRTQV